MKKELKLIDKKNVIADNIHYPTTEQLAKLEWKKDYIIESGTDAKNASNRIIVKIRKVCEKEKDALDKYYRFGYGGYEIDYEEKAEEEKILEEDIKKIEKKIEILERCAENIYIQSLENE